MSSILQWGKEFNKAIGFTSDEDANLSEYGKLKPKVTTCSLQRNKIFKLF